MLSLLLLQLTHLRRGIQILKASGLGCSGVRAAWLLLHPAALRGLSWVHQACTRWSPMSLLLQQLATKDHGLHGNTVLGLWHRDGTWMSESHLTRG